MNSRGHKRRGQPLVMLGFVLFAWIAARAVFWETPFQAPIQNFAQVTSVLAQTASASESSAPRQTANPLRLVQAETVQAQVGDLAKDGQDEAARARVPARLPEMARPELMRPEPVRPEVAPRPALMEPATAVGHHLLWMQAMAYLPVPRSVNARLEGIGKRLKQERKLKRAEPAFIQTQDRWSLDGWAFWRSGQVIAPLDQGILPIYGASQAGAVLSYRLAPGSAHDPRAYARAYKALVSGGEREIAAGLSARPLSIIPARVHGELRATHTPTGTHLRPAGFVTSEIPPISLPVKARAEIYAQAGYVGGRDATAFADGQIHLLRDVGGFDLARLSVGGGAWGGAQKGARRIDLGPSVRVDLKLGQTPARLSLDWRERVAGNAAPKSGAAVTLSTRF